MRQTGTAVFGEPCKHLISQQRDVATAMHDSARMYACDASPAHFALQPRRRHRGRLRYSHWNALERLVVGGILVLLAALAFGL